MTTNEIEDGLASLGAEHPFRRALQALLDNCVTDEQGAVTQPSLTDAARHFNAGRLAHALDLRGVFQDFELRGQERLAAQRQEKQ